VASTFSPPLALDSICWGSGGGGSGRVASSFPGCSCVLSASGSPTGGSGAGVAEFGSGSSNPKADKVLTMQNQKYHQTSRKSRRYIMNKELHSQRGFLYAGLLQSQCLWFYNHGTHCRWRGHTSRGHGMSRRVTRHGNGHDRCRSSRQVRPNSFCRTTCWNIIPGKYGPDHLLALGVGRRRRRTATQTKQASNKHKT
jgi:hypothetical protein